MLMQRSLVGRSPGTREVSSGGQAWFLRLTVELRQSRFGCCTPSVRTLVPTGKAPKSCVITCACRAAQANSKLQFEPPRHLNAFLARSPTEVTAQMRTAVKQTFSLSGFERGPEMWKLVAACWPFWNLRFLHLASHESFSRSLLTTQALRHAADARSYQWRWSSQGWRTWKHALFVSLQAFCRKAPYRKVAGDTAACRLSNSIDSAVRSSSAICPLGSALAL